MVGMTVSYDDSFNVGRLDAVLSQHGQNSILIPRITSVNEGVSSCPILLIGQNVNIGSVATEEACQIDIDAI
jgi:hypothetical protein